MVWTASIITPSTVEALIANSAGTQKDQVCLTQFLNGQSCDNIIAIKW